MAGIYADTSDVRESIFFALVVPAGATGELRYQIMRSGTIERLVVRFYVGCELQLRIRPVLERRGKGEGSGSNIIKFVQGGNTWVDGDDDEHVFQMAYAVRQGDYIVIGYENLDVADAYNFRVTVDIDYLGGESRTMPGVV